MVAVGLDCFRLGVMKVSVAELPRAVTIIPCPATVVGPQLFTNIQRPRQLGGWGFQRACREQLQNDLAAAMMPKIIAYAVADCNRA